MRIFMKGYLSVLSLFLLPFFSDAALPVHTEPPGEDSLVVQVVCPSRFAMSETVTVRLVEKRRRVRVGKDGVAVIRGVAAGSYSLVAEGARIRKSVRKVSAEQFGKDTLRVEVQPLWVFENAFQINFAQHSFSPYWKAGGVSSMAIGFRVFLAAHFKQEKRDWRNTIDFQYGIIRQGEFNFNKNIDQFEFNSQYNLHFDDRWNFSSLLNVRSSLHNNYSINKDGSRGAYIGGFMSPGYINIGTGVNYQVKQPFYLNLYYSPLNSKMTYVRDSSLAPQYIPVGDHLNPHFRFELGSFLKVEYRQEVLKNVVLHSRADFFTSHLSGFGNIDINWENILTLKVNDYLSANLSTQLIYDDDIMFDITDEAGQSTGRKGPRTQFRESFNVGLTHRF